MAVMRNQSRVVKASAPLGKSVQSHAKGQSEAYKLLPQEYKDRANVQVNDAFMAARRARIARNNRTLS